MLTTHANLTALTMPQAGNKQGFINNLHPLTQHSIHSTNLKRQHNIQGTLQSHDNENNSAVYYYTITGHDNRIKLLYIQHPFPPMTYLIPGDIPWRQLRPIPHSGSSYKTPMGYPS
jgi:hypothetical protein